MNIFQFGTSAMSDSLPVGEPSQEPSGSYNNDFELVLGDVLKQYSTGDTIAKDMNCKGGTNRIVEDSHNLNSELMTLPGYGKSFLDSLGVDIVSLAAMLLEGSESSNDQESLLEMLSTVLQQIGDFSSSDTNSLSELMSQVQDPGIKGSLLDELQKALSGLPEPLKNKLQGSENDNLIDQISSDEITVIQTITISTLTAVLPSKPFTDLQNTDSLLGDPETPYALRVAVDESALGGNILQKNDPESTIRVPAGVPGERAVLEVGPIVKPEVKTNHLNDPASVGEQPEKTDKEVAVSALNKDMADLSQQGKSEQNLKAIGKTNSDMDVETNNGGKARTSLIAPAKVSVEGSQSDNNSTSMDAENQHSNDRTSLLSDVSQSTIAKQEPDSTQVTFSQTLDKASLQGVVTQPEPAAQAARLEQPFINTDKLLAHIVGKLDILLSEGRTEAKLKLKPEFLGDLKIHLIMDGGSMKAVLNASTLQAKELIEANLSLLKQSLENQGLQLKEFEVSVNQQQNNESNSFYRQRHNGHHIGADDGIEQPEMNELDRSKTYVMPNGKLAVNYLV